MSRRFLSLSLLSLLSLVCLSSAASTALRSKRSIKDDFQCRKDGLFASRKYCNLFWICLNSGTKERIKIPYVCGTGYANPKFGTCDWPANVDCDGELAPIPSTPHPVAPTTTTRGFPAYKNRPMISEESYLYPPASSLCPFVFVSLVIESSSTIMTICTKLIYECRILKDL